MSSQPPQSLFKANKITKISMHVSQDVNGWFQPQQPRLLKKYLARLVTQVDEGVGNCIHVNLEEARKCDVSVSVLVFQCK